MIARVFQVWRLTRGLGPALLVLATAGRADTLRVTTWNLQPTAVGSASSGAPGAKDIRIPEMAAVLKTLDADVILLQQVRDWKMCEELVQALKPANYSVLVCSAFQDARTGTAGQRQVAILARQRAYLSWSQPWGAEGAEGSPGGFAFAAIQTRGQRLGFFSVEPGDKSAFMRQLLGQVASVRNWVTNRVQIFVVGATLDNGSADWPAAHSDTLRLFQGAGFADVFLEALAIERITLPRRAGQRAAQADYLFTQPPGCAINPHVLSNTVAEHYPVTCDLELDPARIAAAWAARSEALSARETPPANGTNYPLKPLVLAQPSTLNPQLLAALTFAGIVALLAVVWALARRKRAPLPKSPGLLPADAGSAPGALSSYTVVVGTQSGTGPGSPPAAASSIPAPMIHIEAPGTTQTQAEMLRQRARAAEERADRATAAIRAGLIPHLRRWLKQKLLRRLIADRTQMLETQQAATLKAMSVEARLARVELQIQQQNHGYQQRIETLSRELIAAKEENRELIRAQIRQVKAEMEAARARLMAQAEREL